MPVWGIFTGPVAAKFWVWVAERCEDYLLGLFRSGWGVFLSSTSLRGTNLEDLILFDWLKLVLWIPDPMILIGRGWKSNCWMFKKTSADEVNLATGMKVI